MVVGHITPEAFDGGALALVKSGDSITVDAKKRLIQVNVSKAELARRRAKWKPPRPKYASGVLAKYARQVRSASEGAVTD
jgi:dihydroxy-acid dehydratase